MLACLAPIACCFWMRRISLPPLLKRCGGSPLIVRRRGAKARLAHMGHIEQACLLAGPTMLGQDTVPVLHRHLVPGKGNHPRA
jgi:hypothetical protein